MILRTELLLHVETYILLSDVSLQHSLQFRKKFLTYILDSAGYLCFMHISYFNIYTTEYRKICNGSARITYQRPFTQILNQQRTSHPL